MVSDSVPANTRQLVCLFNQFVHETWSTNGIDWLHEHLHAHKHDAGQLAIKVAIMELH